jgi:hypothetical protein
MGTEEILGLISNRPDFFPVLQLVISRHKELNELWVYSLRDYHRLRTEKNGFPLPGTNYYTATDYNNMGKLRVKLALDKWANLYDFQYYIKHPVLGAILVNRYKNLKESHLVNEFTLGSFSYQMTVTSETQLNNFLGNEKNRRLKMWGQIRDFVKGAIK